MSIEDNKESIRTLRAEAFNKGNLAVINELIPAGFVFHGANGQEYKGPEGVKVIVTALRTAFSDFHVTIEDMIAEGDKVAHQFTFTGTHDGELGGITPTGKRVKMKAAVFSLFRGGKEVEVWEYAVSNPSLYEQLGITPPTQ